jgi:diphthine-ammonia ligase
MQNLTTDKLMTQQIPMAGQAFVCAWDGSRDACLALYRAICAGAKPEFLLTMLDETGQYSHSLPIPRAVLQAQALSLNIPLLTKITDKQNYQLSMLDMLHELRQSGIEIIIFGDILSNHHRSGTEILCAQAGLQTYLPLWGTSKSRILAEFITTGFNGLIITATEQLGENYIGRYLDPNCIEEIEELDQKQHIDLIGAHGEYNTVVVDGPIFADPISLGFNPPTLNEGVWRANLYLRSLI